MKSAWLPITFALLLCAATWLGYSVQGKPNFGIDDAQIFLGYSENLVAGHGITYAGNSEPVEGFTSLLWMLLGALVLALGGNETTLLFVSFLILLLTQGVILHTMRAVMHQDHGKNWAYELPYVILILCAPAYVVWMTITLMDTVLWGLCAAVMVCGVVLPPRSSAGKFICASACVFSPLVRPEGMLLTPILLLLIWIRSRQTDDGSMTRFCVTTLLAFLACLASLLFFRMAYFGYPLPNTYYAKVSPSLDYNLRQGWMYLLRFAMSGLGTLTLVLAVFLNTVISLYRAAMTRFKQEPGPGSWASLACMPLLILPVLTGGDHFALYRFYQPAYPILCMAMCLLLSEHRILERAWLPAHGWKPVYRFMQIVAVCLLGYWIFLGEPRTSWRGMARQPALTHEFQLAEEGLKHGRAIVGLFETLPNLPTIGILTAGGFGRTYPGPIVDLLGLNNTVIAHYEGRREGMKNHAAFEIEAFFQVHPDVLIVAPPIPSAKVNRLTGLLRGLFDDPRFRDQWRYGVLSSTKHPERAQAAFYRKSFLEAIPEKAGLTFRDTVIWKDGWIRATESPGHVTPP